MGTLVVQENAKVSLPLRKCFLGEVFSKIQTVQVNTFYNLRETPCPKKNVLYCELFKIIKKCGIILLETIINSVLCPHQ